MHIKVVRRGGLMGIPMSGEVDTTSLPPKIAAAAQRALTALPVNKAAAPPTHPDGFQFEIQFGDGAAQSSLNLDESEVDDDLQPVIDAAMENSTLG